MQIFSSSQASEKIFYKGAKEREAGLKNRLDRTPKRNNLRIYTKLKASKKKV